MWVLSIKVPIRKKSGNLSYAPRKKGTLVKRNCEECSILQTEKTIKTSVQRKAINETAKCETTKSEIVNSETVESEIAEKKNREKWSKE